MEDDTETISSDFIVESEIFAQTDALHPVAEFKKQIPPDERTTIGKLSLYELTKALCIRVQQIEDGDQILTDYSNLNDPIEIAKKEFMEGKIPLKIHRAIYIEDKIEWFEEWDITELLSIHII